jgi:Gas vesicle synthesis protein GvpL/GvpF
MEMMIYTIVSAKKDPERLKEILAGMKGISGEALFSISFLDVAVVVSNVNKAALITDKTNALEYAGVIETISHHFNVLPVRFGSIVDTEESLMKILERNHEEIQKNLLKVEDKFEFGLKVFCDTEKLVTELRSQTATLITAPTEKPTTPNSVSRDWLIKKLEEHRIEESILHFVDSIIATLTEHLTKLEAVSKFRKRTSSTIIIDAVFLLEKTNKKPLIQLITDIEQDHPELNFVLTGPWPPYNFVDITIQ